jgi:hypothetical protein
MLDHASALFKAAQIQTQSWEPLAIIAEASANLKTQVEVSDKASAKTEIGLELKSVITMLDQVIGCIREDDIIRTLGVRSDVDDPAAQKAYDEAVRSKELLMRALRLRAAAFLMGLTQGLCLSFGLPMLSPNQDAKAEANPWVETSQSQDDVEEIASLEAHVKASIKALQKWGDLASDPLSWFLHLYQLKSAGKFGLALDKVNGLLAAAQPPKDATRLVLQKVRKNLVFIILYFIQIQLLKCLRR